MSKPLHRRRLRLPHNSWVLTAVLVTACQSPSQRAASPESLALIGVNVVDVETGQVHSNRTVLIAGRVITSMEDAETADLPPGSRIVDGSGKYLIPGLWDTHVHLTPFGEAVLPLFVAYGVTAVRDAGSTALIFRWRSEVAAGQRLGPRIWTSGRMLAQVRGADPGPEWDRVDSPEAARQAVEQRQAEGADFLKIQDSFMERELWSALAAEAATRRFKVMGHAPVDLPLATAIRLGLRSIEHTIGLPLALSSSEQQLRQRVMRAGSDSARWTALYEADVEALNTQSSSRFTALATFMRDRGVALSPNLTDSRAMATAGSGRWDNDPRLAMISPAVRELWGGMARAATPANTRNLQQLYERIPAIVLAFHRAGVTILAGTDAWAVYDFPGSDLHSELWHLVQAGLTPLEALRTATLSPARFFKVADSLGSIRPGKLADLVLLEANPLTDIGNTERIAGVVTNGRYLDRAALEAIKVEAARVASAPVQ